MLNELFQFFKLAEWVIQRSNTPSSLKTPYKICQLPIIHVVQCENKSQLFIYAQNETRLSCQLLSQDFDDLNILCGALGIHVILLICFNTVIIIPLCYQHTISIAPTSINHDNNYNKFMFSMPFA